MMNFQQQHFVQECLDALEQGTLTKDRLSAAFEAVTDQEHKQQDLLYLQLVESGLHSKVIGMRMLIDGKYADEPENTGQWPYEEEGWPYESAIDAIKDGWRVISFPNMALSLDENRTYGLGFEFILEKWR